MKVKVWKLLPLLLIIVLAFGNAKTVFATATLQPEKSRESNKQ
jgi:hypothetical protein